MIAKLLAFLSIAATALGAHYRNVITDTAYVQDTYISSASGDSVTNYGKSVYVSVASTSVGLIKANNLRAAIGLGRAITACTLAVATGAIGGTAGTLGVYRTRLSWGEGWIEGTGGYRRAGAAWRYRNMPSYPDTTAQASLPSAFSWADSGLTTDPGNQGSCGTCYAFGASGAVESAAKIQVANRLVSYNEGNGVGADRNTLVYDTARVTGTGWISFTISPAAFEEAWANSNHECGFALNLASTGDFEVWTSEAANSANHPIVRAWYGVDSNGFAQEVQSRWTGTTNISEVLLYGDADSMTNHGTDSTARITSTNKTFLLKINSIRSLLGDSVVYIGSSTGGAICSLKVKEKTTDGRINSNRSLKKWVENEATGKIWKTGYGWGGFQSSLVNELDVSEQELLDCAAGMGCTGGSCREALEWWRMNGIYSEELIPFTSGVAGVDDNDCDTAGLGAVYAETKWWWPIDHSTRNRLKQAILIRPVAAHVTYGGVGESVSFDNLNDNTCYYRTGAGSSNHAILIVGWDDSFICGNADSTGAWIIQNSKGDIWGEGGLGYISYRYYPLVPLASYSPSSETFTIVETVQDPELWTGAGMVSGTDYDSLPIAQISVSADPETWYYIPIPADIVQQWYDYNENSFGVCLRQISTLGQDFFSSEVTNPTYTTYKPQLIVHSTDRVTVIGNAKLGNVKIGN